MHCNSFSAIAMSDYLNAHILIPSVVNATRKPHSNHLSYITEHRSPWIIRPFWPNLPTFVFFTVLTCPGHSKPVLDRFSLTRAIRPYAKLPVTPSGCQVMSKCRKTHYTLRHTTKHHQKLNGEICW